ncbi:MAG: L-rhamnose mutarotase [Gammaproteobacteria bacterium]
MSRLYFALDLHDDPVLIAEYERWHRADRVWPEVVYSIRAAGVRDLEIYRTGSRLVLVMDVPEDFDLAAKARADAGNVRVQAWEKFMWKFQRALPWARPGQKWLPMARIFSLQETLREMQAGRRQSDEGS